MMVLAGMVCHYVWHPMHFEGATYVYISLYQVLHSAKPHVQCFKLSSDMVMDRCFHFNSFSQQGVEIEFFLTCDCVDEHFKADFLVILDVWLPVWKS